jgi:hypothetical protein
MMNPFSFFDSIYYISVKGRQAARDRAAHQFSELGILDRVIFFDAILREPYWDGCRESHKECIKIAKRHGAKNVLIFEEDVFFLHKDLGALEKTLTELSRRDWDIFTLGCTIEKAFENTHPNLCVVSGYLNHAYAVNSHFFDTILDFKGSDKYYDGGKKIWSLSRLDLFLTKNNFKKHLMKPLMAVQPDKATKTITSYYNKIL